VALVQTGVRRNPLADLTPRELETLSQLSQGKPYGRIAEELNVSYKTVVNVCSQLKQKLGARNLPELIRVPCSSWPRPRVTAVSAATASPGCCGRGRHTSLYCQRFRADLAKPTETSPAEHSKVTLGKNGGLDGSGNLQSGRARRRRLRLYLGRLPPRSASWR